MDAELQAKRRRARLGMLAVIGVFLVPLLLAIGLYFSGWRPHPTNYGNLVHPAHPLAPLRVVDVGTGSSTSLARLYGKWILLYVGAPACHKTCTGALYKLRAMALFQGDNAHRVRRVLLLGEMPSSARLARLRDRFPGLHILVATGGAWRRLQKELTPAAQPGGVEVLDPLGNWMMWYPPDADARGMRRDLTRLLAISQMG